MPRGPFQVRFYQGRFTSHGEKFREAATVTHVVKMPSAFEPLPTAPWIRIFPVRTPTLPPATHTNVYALEGPDGLSVIDPASPWADEQTLLDDALDALKLPIVEI